MKKRRLYRWKIWLLLAIYLSLASWTSLVAQGATVAGGTIETDTVWTVTESPYLIENDLTIQTGATLTIEPGVEVRFTNLNQAGGESNRVELMVYGRLQAIGTLDHPILFTAETEAADMGSWGGIYLYETGSELGYVQIDRATTALVIAKGATLEWSKIINNLQTGVQVAKGANVNLIGNEFTYNRVGLFVSGTGKIQENRLQSNNYGMILQGVENLTIEANSVESNTYGIYLEQLGAGNQILNSSISSNTYGIYLDSGSSPVVNYCDIYNNTPYDFYHQGAEDVQATHNWWGTSIRKQIDDYIFDQNDNTSGVTYGYVQYEPFLEASALAPTVLNVVSDPAAIGEGTLTVTVTFSKEMNRVVEPTISYGLYEPYTTYLVDPAVGEWLSSTQYRFTLNIGAAMEEGLYRFNIQDGESFDGQQLKSNIIYTFMVDRTPPTVFTGVDYFAFSPNGDGVKDQLQAHLYFDEMATYSYSIYQEGLRVVGPVESAGFGNEAVLSWDGRDSAGLLVTEGSYQIQLTLTDQAGNQTSSPVVIPVVVDCTQPTLAVNPLSGILTSDPEITGLVEDVTTPTTYLAYRQRNETTWIPLTQIEGNQNGSLYTWNVLNLEESSYELMVRTVDLAGNERVELLALDLDLHDPQVVISQPVPDQHFMGSAIFAGEISDYHLSSWVLELEVDGQWVTLTSGTTEVQGEILQLDLTNYADGPYRYRIVAGDEAGHQTSRIQTLHVDNYTLPQISGKSVMPQQFSPNGDGRKDQVRFQFNFSEPVDWQLAIQNQAGEVIRTYQEMGPLASVSWDGLNEDGIQVSDGNYSYYLTYQDQVGHVGEPYSGQVTIDTIAPELAVAPWPEVTNQLTFLLEGNAQGYDQLRINGQMILVDQGHFSLIKDLVEGENQYEVIAEDQAGNQTVVLVEVIRDTLAPIFHFEQLKELTNQEETQIIGWIEEANLVSRELTLRNSGGERQLALELSEEQAFDLNVSLKEGENQLTFVAIDGAGNRTETSVVVRHLPTIAEVELVEPARPYWAKATGEIILQVLEGTVAVDPATIWVEMDGLSVPFTWDATTQQIICQVQDLTEGSHSLRANVENMLGEPGSGLDLELVVDLTDPVLQLNNPADQAILDGWDGDCDIDGRVEDQYLESLTINLTPVGGQLQLLLSQNLEGETSLEGVFTTLQVGDLPNGEYTLVITVQDLAGRTVTEKRAVEIHNTGLIEGQVFGDLEQILEPMLYLVVGSQIYEEVSFDQLTGFFSQRVAVGDYDLVLMPWGYDPVLLPDLQIEVGQIYRGLELTFEAQLILTIDGEKQLLALPVQMNTAPPEGVNLVFEGYDGKDYYPIEDWSQLQPGTGYWITGSEELNLDLDAQPVPKEEYRTTLQKGWNLISTPYNYPYPLDGLQFVLEGKTYSYTSGQQAGLIDGGLWDYRDWYQDVEQLEPWVGYWLYVNKTGEVIFSPDQAILPYTWKAVGVSAQQADLIQDPEWQIQMRAKLGQSLDVQNYLGTSWAGTDGLDPGLDLREPPGYSPYVSLYFLEAGGEKLTSSYLAPVQGLRGERSWQMVVAADLSGWVQLSWDLAPDSILSLELQDLTTGEIYNMFGQATYEFFYQKGTERKFVVTAKKGQFEIKKAFNYPNPFSPDHTPNDGQRQGTRIRYLLTHDADVKVEVVDVMGRLVKRLTTAPAGSQGGKEGWNEIYWNGYNGRNQPVANGTYILKLTATKGKARQEQLLPMAVINRR